MSFLLAVLAACSSATSGPTTPSLAKETAAVSGAFQQSLSQTPDDSASPYTLTYTSAGGGTAVLSLQADPWSAGTGICADYGTLAFTGYVDTASGEKLDGSLKVILYQTGGAAPDFGPHGQYNIVEWGGFTGYADLTGTVTLTGQTSGSITVDTLATFNGSTIALSGTFALGGDYFDAGTGAEVTAPVPTVTFSPTYADVTNYNPSGSGGELVLTSAGSTIYYTLDGSVPSAGHPGTTQYTGPDTSDTNVAVALAYAVQGSRASRLSVMVYPVQVF